MSVWWWSSNDRWVAPTADGGEASGGGKEGVLASDVRAVDGEDESPGVRNKRPRIGVAAPSRTPCPNHISAFKKAVKCYYDNPAENVITQIPGTSLDSLGEAYGFYNLYSWEKGFGIRFGKSRLLFCSLWLDIQS